MDNIFSFFTYDNWRLVWLCAKLFMPFTASRISDYDIILHDIMQKKCNKSIYNLIIIYQLELHSTSASSPFVLAIDFLEESKSR